MAELLYPAALKAAQCTLGGIGSHNASATPSILLARLAQCCTTCPTAAMTGLRPRLLRYVSYAFILCPTIPDVSSAAEL